MKVSNETRLVIDLVKERMDERVGHGSLTFTNEEYIKGYTQGIDDFLEELGLIISYLDSL